jgi:hypothetical protein
MVFKGLKHRVIAAQPGISEGASTSNLSHAGAILQKAVANSLNVVKKKLSTLHLKHLDNFPFSTDKRILINLKVNVLSIK